MRFFLLFLFCISSSFAAESNWQKHQSDAAQVRLLASFYEKDGETKLIAGLHFKVKSGWKIYGNDSARIGLPPQFNFAGSKNYLSHQIVWPKAHVEEEKIGDQIFKYSVYKDEIIIPLEIKVEKTDAPAELFLKLDYGVCKDVCIPASENFILKVESKPDENTLNQIQKNISCIVHRASCFDNFNSRSTKHEARSTNYPLPLTPSIFPILLLALIGGAILNIMPCVLPVLSIKLLSVIEHADAAISRIRFAFLATILGILFCFVIFAFLAVLIKITGNSLGWGLQFQNHYFLIFLIIVLTFFTANLLGIFEISFNQILANLLNKKISREEKNIFIPNFFSGILAVMLATPCSAPFLGSAISFALAGDFVVIFAIFMAIGIGFASPYIVLIASPQLVRFLPKPGMWMVKVKQLMAGFLAATIIWLVYILSHNLGALPALLVAIFAVMILGCLKIKSNLLKFLTIIVMVISAFAIPSDLQKYHQTRKYNDDSLWRNFNEAEIYHLVAEGKVVVVDITADWCITCKFNKFRVLQNEEIVAKLERGQIIGMS